MKRLLDAGANGAAVNASDQTPYAMVTCGFAQPPASQRCAHRAYLAPPTLRAANVRLPIDLDVAVALMIVVLISMQNHPPSTQSDA